MKKIYINGIAVSCLIGSVFLFLFISASCAAGSGTAAHQHEDHSHKVHSGAGISLLSEPVKLIAGGPAVLTFNIKDDRGGPAKDISISHDRILHVIIISEDMRVFAHIHPEDFGNITPEIIDSAQFIVRYNFPSAGRYLIAADASVNNTHVSGHFMVEVTGSPVMGALRRDLAKEKKFGDYDVKLTSTPERIAAKKETVLRYEIRENGGPVTELESYLSAPMHVAVVLNDMSDFIHAHGTVPSDHAGHHPVGHIHASSGDRFGPVIEANVVFPVKGTYSIFSEVKHRGRVLLMNFMVEVE
ncbi:MAG: hypothetical protein AB1499_17935 [Nitrospirota bacterium]